MNYSKIVFVAAAFVALAVFPAVSGQYGLDLATKIMVFAIFALSLELLVGTPAWSALARPRFWA